MTDRQQTIAPRERRPAAKKPSARPTPRGAKASAKIPGAKRRGGAGSVGRWLRGLGLVAVAALVLCAYFVVADSATFAINHVEIEGTKRLSKERLEAAVRKAAGPRMLNADLDAVTEAIEREPYVKSVSIARVLPDTLRVRVEEREPSVVVRLKSGKFGWADEEGRLLDDYAPQPGSPMPPPLLGFEDEDRSERAAADNRDRVARYNEIRGALSGDPVWDHVDEIDVRYLNDPKVQLTDNSVVVRVGDRDYKARLQTALGLLAAVRQGDVETLMRYHVPDVSRLLASADSINFIDAARGNGVTVSCGTANGSARPAQLVAAAPPRPEAVNDAGDSAGDAPLPSRADVAEEARPTALARPASASVEKPVENASARATVPAKPPATAPAKPAAKPAKAAAKPADGAASDTSALAAKPQKPAKGAATSSTAKPASTPPRGKN